MRKFITIVFLSLLALTANAQAKKSFNEAVKELNLSSEKASQLKALTEEKQQKIKEVRNLKINKKAQNSQIKMINKEFYPKTVALLGKVKTQEWNAYWRKK